MKNNKKEIKYRTETLSGSGVRDIHKVIKFEIFELNNIDILETLKNTIFKEDNLAVSWINHVIGWTEGNENRDYDVNFLQDGFCYWLVSYIKYKTGKDIKYALWLADKNVVMDKETYGPYLESENDIDAYEIGDVLLSDIGHDGCLYGYENYPQPIIVSQ